MSGPPAPIPSLITTSGRLVSLGHLFASSCRLISFPSCHETPPAVSERRDERRRYGPDQEIPT